MNSLMTETGYVSLNKFGEQLCGDRVETIEYEDSMTLVLADGLGSGVKANILSTLTSKIIATMMASGLKVEDCVETIASTLPICQVRKIAYSTFTIIQISQSKEATLIQFDNPMAIFLRGGVHQEYPTEEMVVEGKKIYKTVLEVQPGDLLVTMSDGAPYAGVGYSFNYGWQRENIIQFLEARYDPEMTAKMVAASVAEECDALYEHKPGDDTTIAAVRIRGRETVNLMIGPPSRPEDDQQIMSDFFALEGKKIVCGGTTSNVVAGYLHEKVETSLDYLDPAIPPVGHIKGVDLVTEGVITVSRVLQYAHAYLAGKDLELGWADKRDGASQIARTLFEEATDINFYVGKAINPAHQNPDLPINIVIKMQLVEDLSKCLRRMGKKVKVRYY